MKSVTDIYNVDRLIERAKTIAKDIKGRTEFGNPPQWYMHDIADSHQGIYMYKAVCDFFGISFNPDPHSEENDFIWDDIDNAAGDIAEELNRKAPQGCTFYFGNNEGDGSYGLIMIVE